MPIFSTRRLRADPDGLTAVSVTTVPSGDGASWLLITSFISLLVACESVSLSVCQTMILFLDSERASAQNRLQSRQFFLLDANLFNCVDVAERLFEFESEERLVNLNEPVDQFVARLRANL